MSDTELEEIIQTIYRYEREPFLEDPNFYYTVAGEYELRPPATERQIAECEQFIGRSFSPSYRHFLRLHDGWKGFYSSAGIGYLYGTHHLRYDAEAREQFSISTWAHLASRPTDPLDVPDYTNDIYLPENFYRFLDTREPVVQELQPLKDMLVDEPVQEYLSELTQTLLGSETHYQLFLDTMTLGADGEMEVVEWADSNGKRWANFYEFLRDRANCSI